MRHANCFCFRPLRLAHVMKRYIPVIYRLRYQSRLRNVAGAIVEMAFLSLRPGTVWLFFVLEASAHSHKRGWTGLCDLLRKGLPLQWAERHISKVFRTRLAVHETAGPGLALDVDDERAYQTFLAMMDKWERVQAEQLDAAGNKQVAS